MGRGHLWWKVPVALLGVTSGIVLLLLVAVACVLYVPSLRHAALEKGIELAHEQTGYDIEVDDLYLSPFHHSPMVFYHAWRGEIDLPLEVKIDSLFVGHRGQDTLVCIQTLRLNARIKNEELKIKNFSNLPIVVDELRLESTTFHSDSLIPAVGVDAIVGHLGLVSPGLVIADGYYPLHGLLLSDAYVGIDLRNRQDTTKQDTTPLRLAFDIPDGDLHNIHFALTPVGLHITTGSLQPDVLVDVGGNLYDARRLDASGFVLSVGNFHLSMDTIYGNARVELERHLITSDGLHARSDEIGAHADIAATTLDMETMRVEVTGDADFRGSKAQLRGWYDINDQAYELRADVERVNLAPFLQNNPQVVIAGKIEADGKGLDPHSRAMQSRVKLHLKDAIYDNIDLSGMRLDAQMANLTVEGDLHLPVKGQVLSATDDAKPIRYQAQTQHSFRVVDFISPERMGVDYRAQLRKVQAHVAGEDLQAEQIDIRFSADSTTSLHIETEGLNADATAKGQLLAVSHQLSDFNRRQSRTIKDLRLADLSGLDTLRRLLPKLQARIDVSEGSPIQGFIERKGLDVHAIELTLASDSTQTDLSVAAATGDHLADTGYRLPPVQAALRVSMRDGSGTASLTANSTLTDGAMSLHNLRTDADLWFDLERQGNDLHGTGCLTLDDLVYGEMDLGSRSVALSLSRSELYPNTLRADIQPDDIPMEIVAGILQKPDIALHGAVRAQATIDGLPEQFDLSAEVLPLKVSALYKPYDVSLSLGERPIIMNHNQVDFNGLPIYGADSTFLSLTGGMNLNSMQLNVTLAADRFVPAKLVKDGPIPVYGELATDIHGNVTGSLDSLIADVDVTILPGTDITYPIDKKNLAQVKPHGMVNVRYERAADTLLLGGQVNIDDGVIRYSPKAYPIMPFQVDSGSHVSFNGSVGQTLLDVSASQRVKADVESEGEETRRVDFTTGVRVNGVVDSIGLHSIGFFLEAPEDETITQELSSLDEETREGLAATLLATGMYMGESNVAAQRGGYALSSIVNSRLNAAMANSKMGKIVDIDLSSAQTEHSGGTTNDLNLSISKSFLRERLRITVGSTFTNDPEINQASGLLNNLSAEYKLTKEGNVLLRAFAQRDYNNILEGDLYKSGLGVRAKQEWRKMSGDSVARVYGLMADADVAWRSNNSLGPNLTLTHSIKNLLGKNETFTVKGNGAYYWALRDRHPGDPKKTDTYKFGLNTSLVFPYLHWAGDHNPDGDTRYMVGYLYENIAGGYGVHKVSGSFSYFIRSSDYVTHTFTPFSLSLVRMKAESENLLNKAAEYPQLIKLLAGNEFVPAIGYNFTYNDYRSKRAVNTLFEVGIKESGNIINGIYCLFGHTWDELNKPLGNVSFNQFVKLTTELRNKFNITDRVCIATRLFAGANIPLGNSANAPLSEAFYAGGPNGMRAASPYAYGAGNFYSEKYNQNFFHAGDIKLEANFELRFPIVWKLYGATFVDAGNVWNWYNNADLFKEAGITDYVENLQLRGELYDGIINNPYFAQQIALGTGAGLRLDIDGLVVRLDLGVAIHTPYQTYKYDKKWNTDYTQPIETYFNIPSALDALRLNFGIGYPF